MEAFSQVDSRSSSNYTEKDLLQIEKMKEQNKNLRRIVSQLQQQLDSNNEKLGNALEVTAAMPKYKDEIKKLSQQLTTTQQNSIRLKNSLNQKILQLTNQLQLNQAEYERKNDSLAKDLSVAKNSLKNKSKDYENLQDQYETLKTELKALAQHGIKLKKQRDKFKNQIEFYSEQNSLLTNKNEELTQENQTLSKDLALLQSRVEELQLENEKYKKGNVSLKDEITKQKEENQKLNTCINNFQDQFKAQAEDLLEITEERSKLLDLIQKLHRVVCLYETSTQAIQDENKQLKEKAKKAQFSKSVSGLFQPDLLDLNEIEFKFSYNDALQKKIQNILKMDHFQSKQKMKIILNEISKELEEKYSETKQYNTEKEEFHSKSKDFEKEVKELLLFISTIIQEFKYLENIEKTFILPDDISEPQEKSANDNKFIDFIAKTCTKYEKLKNVNDFIGLFVTPNEDILSENQADNRKHLLEHLKEHYPNGYALFSVIFLINSKLKEEIETITRRQLNQEEIRNLLNEFNLKSISEIRDFVENMAQQIEHLKNTRKEVHMALVSAKDCILEKETKNDELKAEINSLKQEIQFLQTENKQIQQNMELQQKHFQQQLNNSANSSLLSETKSAIYGNEDKNEQNNSQELSKSSQQSDQSSSRSIVYKSMIKEMQQTILQRNNEIEDLKRHIQQIEDDKEDEIQAFEQQMKRKEQNMEHEKQLLVEKCQNLSKRLAKTKKKCTDIVDALYTRREEDMKEVETKKEEEKNTMKQIIDETEKKIEAMNQILTQTREEKSELEQKNQELKESNATLNSTLQNLQFKVNHIQEQFTKEQKQKQQMVAAKVFEMETKQQKEMRDLRNTLSKEKEDIISFFTTHIGSLYGIIDLDYDQQTLLQIFSKIQNDLSKLKFFQEQATKI